MDKLVDTDQLFKRNVINIITKTCVSQNTLDNRFKFVTKLPDKPVNTIFGIRKSIQDDVIDFLLSNDGVTQLGLTYESVMKMDLASYRNIKYKLKERQEKIDKLKAVKKEELENGD